MLSSTIRQIARLSESAQPAQLEQQPSEILRRFEMLRALVEASFFEAFPKAPPDEQLLDRAKDYLPQLRAALLIRTGLIHHQGSSSSQCQPDLIVQVQQRSSLLLEEIARQVESNSFAPFESLDPADRSLQNRLKMGAELARQGEVDCDLTELRLCSSLLNVVYHLHGSHVTALDPSPSR
jgi:multidrug resistance protein MdtO